MMTKPQPNMPIYIEFISDVIKSCNTLQQLINTKNWAHNYCRKNGVKKSYWDMLHLQYQKKRRSIQGA